MEVCRPVLQILTRFQTIKCIFHTRFQTRPLKSILVFRPSFLAEIMLSLLRLERKQKIIQFQIRIFLFLSNSFGIETINTFTHSLVPSKTIPDSRPKWARSIPVSRPINVAKNPTRWGDTYLYGLYKGVAPGQKTLLLSVEPR